MVFGAGYLAKRTVKWTARKVGFSERTASRLGRGAKWGVALLTLDVGGLLLDGVADAALEGFAEDAVADTAADNALDTTDAALMADTGTQSSREAALPDDEEEEEEEVDLEAEEEAYAAACPELADPREKEGYASEGGEDEEDEVEDAAEVLEEIQLYIAMAKEAYDNASMTTKFDGAVEASQVISNVIDPTPLFGTLGKTDTEVHVSIMDDESVVFAFRGTEPTDWRSRFGDVLTDLAERQNPVKLYDGSRGSALPVYTAPSHICAHWGFQQGLKDVTDTTNPKHNLKLVLEGLGMQAEDVRSVVCVGHSLGGALATLCAKWCREVAFPEAEIGCVTIGSPRVGNLAFTMDFDGRVVDGLSYRVVNKRDIVPCVPNLLTYPSLGSAYKHVSRPIYMCADESTGDVTSRLGGPRPSLLNMGFADHLGDSYLASLEAVLHAP